MRYRAHETSHVTHRCNEPNSPHLSTIDAKHGEGIRRQGHAELMRVMLNELWSELHEQVLAAARSQEQRSTLFDKERASSVCAQLKPRIYSRSIMVL